MPITDNVMRYVDANGAFQQVGTTAPLPQAGATTTMTFHDAATTAADGTPFTVGAYKTLTVEISGTSTSRTVAFIGKGASGAAIAINGVNLATLAVTTSTTGTGELWQFDLSGLTTVLMDLTAVAGGNVSVKGKAVA